MLTKINEFYAEVDAADFDIYMLTETGLNDSVISSNLLPPAFETYRCDRSINTSSKQSGGGVLISVNKKYNSELILNGENEQCEQVWIKIVNGKKKLFLGVLYIPPNSSATVYENHMILMKKVCDMTDVQTTVALYGDFNLPMLCWQESDMHESTYFATNITNKIEDDTIESLNGNGLMQIN